MGFWMHVIAIVSGIGSHINDLALALVQYPPNNMQYLDDLQRDSVVSDPKLTSNAEKQRYPPDKIEKRKWALLHISKLTKHWF